MPFLSLRISISGDFSNMLDFLSNLEGNPYPPYRLIEVSGLTIKRLEEKNLINSEESLLPGDLETILNIKIYTQ